MVNLSGNAYISARMRGESYPLRNPHSKIKIGFHQLKVVWDTNVCDHTETICPSPDCVESWGLGDWQLFLLRTGGGRKFVRMLRLEQDDLDMLAQPNFPNQNHLPSCSRIDRHSEEDTSV